MLSTATGDPKALEPTSVVAKLNFLCILLTAMSVAIVEPSPVMGDTSVVQEFLTRWEIGRTPPSDPALAEIAQRYLNDNEISPPISLTLAAQTFMVEGDMRAAFSALDKALDITPQANIPLFVLGDFYYRLAFFDMVDRGLCQLKLVPIEEVPEASLHHGHLQIEILELVSSGRPVAYQKLLALSGVDQQMQMRLDFYLLWLVRRNIFGEPPGISQTLKELGGAPKTVPIPICRPDDWSKVLLRLSRDAILDAENGDPVETPGVVIANIDRSANILVRIQVLLAEEIIPIRAPASLTVPSDILIPDFWRSVIKKVYANVDESELIKIKGRYLETYRQHRRRMRDACLVDTLTQCLQVGVDFLKLGQLGYVDAYADAIHTFTLVLNLNPTSGQAHFYLGRTYYALATESVSLKVRGGPASSQERDPGFGEEEAEMFERALTEFQAARSVSSSTVPDKSLKDFIQRTKLELVDYFTRSGYRLEQEGNFEYALSSYEKAHRLDPKSYVVNFNKGNTLYALSRFQEAIRAYEEALRIRPYAAEAASNREIARLQAAGIPWTNRERVVAFSKVDLKSKDRRDQIGAILVLYVQCSRNIRSACAAYEEVEKDLNLRSLLKEMGIYNSRPGG